MRGKVLTKTHTLTAEEWLMWWRSGISGHEAAAVCGVDKWKTALEVYLDKMNSSPEGKTTEAMHLGKQMKTMIAREFMSRTGKRVVRCNAIYQHREHPFMIATIDRWLVGTNEGLLCKSVGEYRKDEWKDGVVPEAIHLQCQHLMAVSGASNWWVAVLIGGNKLRTVRVDRDEAAIEKLIRSEMFFWREHVEKRIPPQPDGSDASSRLLREMYPAAVTTPKAIELPVEAMQWIEQYKTEAAVEKGAAHRRQEAENQLKNILGSSELGYVDNYRVEWKTIRRKTDKLNEYRRFSIYPI